MSDDGASNRTIMWIVAASVVAVALGLLLVIQGAGQGSLRYDRGDAALYCVHSDQCERPADGKPIAEFQNTLSNLGYLFFGVCALVRAFRPGAGLRPGPFMFGLGMCFLAFFSMYYHATLNFDGTVDGAGALRQFDPASGNCRPAAHHSDFPQVWDIVGVYLVLFVLFFNGVERLMYKRFEMQDAGRVVSFLGFAVGLPLAAIIVPIAASRTPAAGIGVVGLLAILSLFIVATHVARRGGRVWLVWVIWSVVVPSTIYLALLMRTDLGWDSTWVFAVMMMLLIAIIGVNWTFAGNTVPWVDVATLGVVFVAGVLPRLLDGYGLTDGDVKTLFQKTMCSPDGAVQAHALWHLASALALALSFDMLEKSRTFSPEEGAPGTILLPADDWMTAAMAGPIDPRTAFVVLFKAFLTLVAIVLPVAVLHDASRSGFWLILASFLPAAVAASLWLLPLFAGRRG